MRLPTSNPFDLLRAADFTDDQILDYWVDFSPGALMALLEPTAATSKHILGGKGSGKTHLFRFCSYQVQKLRHKNALLEGIREEGYLGIFLRANTLDTGRFAGKGVSDDQWDRTFNYYFELRIFEQLLTVIDDISCNLSSTAVARMLDQVKGLFDSPIVRDTANSADLLAEIVSIRKAIDFKVNNSAYTRDLDVTIDASPGSLVFGLADLLCGKGGPLSGVQILYLIDEVENLALQQQRFLNTLLRHRHGPCSFRVGARLYGIKTHKLYGADEENREGSEFRRVYLDQLMRANTGYEGFVRKLCARRLVEYDPEFSKVGENSLSSDLDKYFVEPIKSDWYRAVTSDLVKNEQPSCRKYFAGLRKELLESRTAVPLLPADKVDAVDAVIANLQVERYPLLEKLNVFLLYQKWYQGKRLVPAAEAISKKCWAFVAGEESREYRRAYGHFALDMLAQLFRQYKRPCLPIYCGLPSFVQMSAGVPRNALLIMQNAFKWASFNGEQPFASAPVSGATQWEALLESSVFFEEEEARPGEEVPDIRQCIGRLAEFLRAVRFASKPVEVSPLAFSTDAAALTQTAKRNLELAENWSFLFRDNRGRPNKNSNQIDPKYQLNPMLSPKWELPIAVRGDVWLPPRLAIAIFDSAESGSFKERMEEVVSRYMAPEFGKKAGSLVLTTSPLFPDAPD